MFYRGGTYEKPKVDLNAMRVMGKPVPVTQTPRRERAHRLNLDPILA